MKVKFLFFSLIVSLFIISACNNEGTDSNENNNDSFQNTKNTTMISQEDSVFYSLGVSIGSNLKTTGIGSINTVLLSKGLTDIINGGDLVIAPEQAEMILQKYFNELQNKKNEKNKQDGIDFLARNKSEKGVITLESGLQYEVMKSGDGKQASSSSTVTVHYHGTLIDGTVFDSSVDRGEPAEFPVNGVIQGWQEIIPMMKIGDKWKVFIPQELAYGEHVRPGGAIQPFMALIFEIELLDVQDGTPNTSQNK